MSFVHRNKRRCLRLCLRNLQWYLQLSPHSRGRKSECKILRNWMVYYLTARCSPRNGFEVLDVVSIHFVFSALRERCYAFFQSRDLSTFSFCSDAVLRYPKEVRRGAVLWLLQHGGAPERRPGPESPWSRGHRVRLLQHQRLHDDGEWLDEESGGRDPCSSWGRDQGSHICRGIWPYMQLAW